MSQVLLTIIVPTYNRSAHLAVLLAALRFELQGIDSFVEVLVSDNASTDATPEVTAAAARDWPRLIIKRNDRNLGPEGNFLACVSSVSTRYFWIIGDDDCPKLGVLPKVVRLLTEKEPALIYMQSEWVNPLVGPEQGEAVGDLRVSDLSALQFSKAAHVFVTFISGMVIDNVRLRTVLNGYTIDRFNATSLVQLGWVLPLLKSDGPFLFIHDRCMLATNENSGGYPVVTVFGVNFSRIVKETFGAKSPLSKAFIYGNITRHLPGLIWGARDPGRYTSYTAEHPWTDLNVQLGASWMYWLLLVPIGRLPRWLANIFFQCWRVLNRLRRELQKHIGL